MSLIRKNFFFKILKYFYLETLLSFSFMKKLTVRMEFDSLKVWQNLRLKYE